MARAGCQEWPGPLLLAHRGAFFLPRGTLHGVHILAPHSLMKVGQELGFPVSDQENGTLQGHISLISDQPA